MNFEEKKEAYARLIVKAGVNVRKDQIVYMTCPIEAYDFGRLVCKYAYLEGAKVVYVKWIDNYLTKLSYNYSPMDIFENVPEWRSLELNSLAKMDACFIHLIGEDPEVFKDCDKNKQMKARMANFEACKEYYKMQSSMEFKWNVSAVPVVDWAKKVFPNLEISDAMNKLWDAVFTTVRITDSDPYPKWIEHANNLKEKAKKLNEWQFDHLIYENSLGTNFKVGLVKNHIWEGGADTDKVDNGRFFANMPTEEVFTMPDRNRAEGVLKSALPLSYQGNLIKNFTLVFKDGKVVEYDAEIGKDALSMLLDLDEGSRHLGECALVPLPSPVFDTGILFLETLFDENAACHFALGACYETNILGGTSMSEEELISNGGNQSINHVDFMVGTTDLNITGVKSDGTKIKVFENGTWAF